MSSGVIFRTAFSILCSTETWNSVRKRRLEQDYSTSFPHELHGGIGHLQGSLSFRTQLCAFGCLSEAEGNYIEDIYGKSVARNVLDSPAYSYTDSKPL